MSRQPRIGVKPLRSTHAFYRRVLHALEERDVPFCVGGAFAFTYYCGFRRRTKDLDLFIREEDWEASAKALAEEGIATELRFPHWLGKATDAALLVDLIFSSGNGIARVDESWMTRAPRARLWDVSVRMCPPEEMIWSKAYVMERERFDGADVLHMVRATGATLDWVHLLDRFADHWRVLLAHLMLFDFVYPGHADQQVPRWVMDELLWRAQTESGTPASPLCRGTLLSRAQYLVDIEQWGYVDARMHPHGPLSPELMQNWTDEIDPRHRPVR